MPIILDLSLNSPDGSHHYTPPAPETLLSITDTLRSRGIIPVGIAKSPNVTDFARR